MKHFWEQAIATTKKLECNYATTENKQTSVHLQKRNDADVRRPFSGRNDEMAKSTNTVPFQNECGTMKSLSERLQTPWQSEKQKGQIASRRSTNSEIKKETTLSQIVTNDQEKKKHTETVLCKYLVVINLLEFFRGNTHAEADYMDQCDSRKYLLDRTQEPRLAINPAKNALKG